MFGKVFLAILMILGALALDWAILTFLVWLVCLCFGWEFNLLIATGVWIIELILIVAFRTIKK